MEKIKRRVGRPRKSEEEKKANRAKYNKEYWKNWSEKLSEEQKAKRLQAGRISHDKWYSEHKEDWNAYMREYRRRKKEEREKRQRTNSKGLS